MKIYIEFDIATESDLRRLPEFYISEELVPWDFLEVHPVKEIETGFFETCNNGEEDFWSVYLHRIEGGLICIADVKTENEANELSKLISDCSNSRIHYFI